MHKSYWWHGCASEGAWEEKLECLHTRLKAIISSLTSASKALTLVLRILTSDSGTSLSLSLKILNRASLQLLPPNRWSDLFHLLLLLLFLFLSDKRRLLRSPPRPRAPRPSKKCFQLLQLLQTFSLTLWASLQKLHLSCSIRWLKRSWKKYMSEERTCSLNIQQHLLSLVCLFVYLSVYLFTYVFFLYVL